MRFHGVASIEDAAACDERADALVSGLLGRVMRRRGTIATALDYVRSLARDTRANCWELAERAGHGLPYRMQGLLGRSRWRWEDLRDLLPGLAQDVLAGDPGDGIGPGLAIDETADLRKGASTVILSFCVSRGRDLRRPVVDSVADGRPAALSRLSYPSRSLPDRTPADRWSPSARASWRRSCAFSSASCLLRSRAAVSLARSDASVDRCPAGMAPPAEPAALAFCRRRRIWLLMSAWV